MLTVVSSDDGSGKEAFADSRPPMKKHDPRQLPFVNQCRQTFAVDLAIDQLLPWDSG
jgi:hypothetical protein